MKELKRDSNIELLRIFSMLIIIIYHYCTALTVDDTPYIFNQYIREISECWGALGVDIFIVISAWFLCEKNSKFNLWKILRIIFETSFYTTVLFLIATLTEIIPFSIKDMIKAVLTPFIGTYWFITAYIVFYFLTPLLKICVSNIKENQYDYMLIVLTIIVPIFQMLVIGNPNYGVIATFCYIFILVGYLKSNPNNYFEKKSNQIVLINGGILILFAILGDWKVVEEKYSIFIIFQAVSLFYSFKNLKIGNRKLINQLAGSVFGVYILHQYRPLLDIIWYRVFCINKFYGQSSFVIHLIFTAVVILLLGVIIDKIRIVCVENPCFSLLDRISMISENIARINQNINGK